MPINRKTLDNILKPSNKVLKLTSHYSPDRAKRVLDNLDALMPILVKSGSTKTEGLKKFLAWQAKYGKSEGTEVKYRTLASSGHIGRLYPVNSSSGYVGVTRPVRHYLAYDMYTDVDIDNCHPVMIEQLFPIVTGKPSVALNWWNTQRDSIFKDIMSENPSLTRDDCKRIAYTFLYGGDMKHRFKELGLLPNIAANSLYMRCKALCGEMSDFSVCLANMYPDEWLLAENPKNPTDSSKLSVLIQHVERHVALILVECAFKLNLEVGDVCHDGLLLSSGGAPLDQEQIDSFKAYATKEIAIQTGFDLSLSVKAMYEPEWVSLLSTSADAVTDMPSTPYDAGCLLMRLHPHYVTCHGPTGSDELYVWVKDTGRWSSSRNDRLAIAQKFHKQLGKFATDSNKFSNMDIQMKAMNIDNDWIDRTQDSSIGYVLFKDCIWDARNSRTIPFTPDIVFHIQMPNEYPSGATVEDIEFVRKVLFTDPLGEVVGQYRLRRFARSFAGQVDKEVRFCIGRTNNAKSLLGSTFKDALGKYFGEFDATTLLNRKLQSGDEAQRIRPFFLIRWARIAMSQELKSDSSTIGDGNFIKKLSSAGDSLIGRVHGGLETPFRPHYTLDINCNAMIEIDPRDDAIYNRIRVIGYNRQFFLPNQKADSEIYNVDGSLKSEKIRRADEGLKDKLKQKRYLQALVALLVQSYNEWLHSDDKDFIPDEVHHAKLEDFGEANEGSVMDLFLQSFEITNNPDDYVSNDDLKGWLQASKVTVTSRTLNKDIKYYIENAKFPVDETAYRKTTRDKRTQWFWVGIRRICECPDSGLED